MSKEQLILDAILNHQKNNNCTYLLALSCGIDSTYLLSLMQFLHVNHNIQYRVIHFIHGNSESDINAYSLFNLFQQHLNFEAVVYNFYISNETDGRVFRQQKIKEIIRPNEVVLTGHHVNDSAETVLMNLFTGTSIHGMSGISKLTSIDNVCYYRPFIECQIAKEYIETHCGYKHVKDSMNENLLLKRNFIRSNLNNLQRHFPDIYEKINNFSESAKEQNTLNEYLYYFINNSLIVFHYSDITKSERFNCLKIKEMLLSTDKYQFLLLQNWFYIYFKLNHNINLSKKHFTAFCEFIKNGTCLELPYSIVLEIINENKSSFLVVRKTT